MHPSGITVGLITIIVGATVVVAAPLMYGCGDGGGRAGTRAPGTSAPTGAAETSDGGASPRVRRRPSGCAVTPPNHEIPPGQEQNPGAAQAAYHGSGRLWTVLADKGIVRKAPRRDGSIREKFPWWRGVRGPLRVTGRRLDRHGPPLRAHIPHGYGATGFQSTALIFPSEGCWSVRGAVGDASLSFVTLVVKEAGQ